MAVRSWSVSSLLCALSLCRLLFQTGTAYLSHPTPRISPERCQSTTDSVLRIIWNCGTFSQLRSYCSIQTSCLQGRIPTSEHHRSRHSAGGYLAFSVSRYIIENRLPHLPLSGGLVALSPMLDMSLSHGNPTSSMRNPTYSTFHLIPTQFSSPNSLLAHISVKWSLRKPRLIDISHPLRNS